MYNDYRHSLGKTAFQDGRAFACTIRQGCGTFGTTTGEAHYMMQELLKNKGLWLDAKYNVRMVDVWTPLFDVSKHEKCLRKTEEAEKSIAKTTERVVTRKTGNYDYLRFPHWLAHLYYLTYECQRNTQAFPRDEEQMYRLQQMCSPMSGTSHNM